MVFENDSFEVEEYEPAYYIIDGEGRKNCSSGKNNYYLKDHLGSTRMVLDNEGAWQEAVMYDSYGKMEQIGLSGEAVNIREKFTGKEFDEEGFVDGRTAGLGLYYFPTRYYDADIGKWISCDPVSQFHDLYAYAGNGYNPINVVDPDGEKLGFIDWASDEFKFKFEQARSQLLEAGITHIEDLDASDKVITIIPRFGKQAGGASLEGSRLFWNADLVLETKSTGEKLSPTLQLAHEGGHIKETLKTGPWAQLLKKLTPDFKWSNVREKEAILNYEHPAAEALGEGKRQYYGDWKYIDDK